VFYCGLHSAIHSKMLSSNFFFSCFAFFFCCFFFFFFNEYFFVNVNFFSIQLSKFHDTSSGFDGLTRIFFMVFFLINFLECSPQWNAELFFFFFCFLKTAQCFTVNYIVQSTVKRWAASFFSFFKLFFFFVFFNEYFFV